MTHQGQVFDICSFVLLVFSIARTARRRLWPSMQGSSSLKTKIANHCLVTKPIEEMLPNGHTKKIRHPVSITLHNDSVQSSIRHKMPDSHSLVSYEAKVISCEVCEDV